jgi:hypothetical protein
MKNHEWKIALLFIFVCSTSNVFSNGTEDSIISDSTDIGENSTNEILNEENNDKKFQQYLEMEKETLKKLQNYQAKLDETNENIKKINYPDYEKERLMEQKQLLEDISNINKDKFFNSMSRQENQIDAYSTIYEAEERLETQLLNDLPDGGEPFLLDKLPDNKDALLNYKTNSEDINKIDNQI